MIKTKYGNYLSEKDLIEYLDRLIGKVWKLLPLYESDYNNFKINQEVLLQEICGGEKIILYCGFYIELINKLECLGDVKSHKQIKKHIRECIDIIQKLKIKVGEWRIGQTD